jgi:tRNA A37 threonylcarbamoyladenosine modification protein TsaB
MAKGLAWSAGKPIAGISTLRALARKASASGQVSEGDLMLTVLDARKGELYCRLDRVALGKLTPEWKERSLGVERLLEELREISVTVTGETEQLREKAIKSGTLRFLQGEVNLCSAGPVALEGEEALTRGEVLDLRTLEPRYLKEFEPKLKPAGRI